MADENRCPECGRPMTPSGTPGELCPHCLLSMALEPDTDGGSSASPEPPEGTKSTELDAVESTQPGRIGPYRLARKLGEGGMGEVYEAEQLEPVRRKVALKLIKWGMDTRRVVARFEAERQALAMMDHPNIAHVYDAGAGDQGRPYFAMELVKGVPINDYCDRHKLPTQQRLELFMRVCDGVQHAHQKGIIHRDIKPSNVLVTIQDDKPVPKIIDFGVAKATEQRLTEKTVFTELGQLVGTPEYMSPEQAEMTGLDIDTRTDVYSLGVLLYELLSGTLPFEPRELRKAGYDEIRRRIREEEPAKPSTRISSLGEEATTAASNRATAPAALVRRLRGDLDWISMKALEKDRTRRYGSAADLAADVARHLDGEPVLAGPPSTVYRMKKFVRRHRFGVAAASVVALALVLGVIGTTIGMLRAIAAEQQTREEARRSEASKLVVLGERELERFPSGALAYAIKSLEVADTEAGRLLALRVLQNAPVARIAEVGLGEEDGGFALNLDFSPDGEWVATGGFTKSVVLQRDGQTRLLLGEYDAAGQGGFAVRFTPQSDALVANLRGDVRVWSIPEGRELRHDQIDRGFSTLVMGEDDFLTVTADNGKTVLRSWPLGDGEPSLVGTMHPLGRRDWDATRAMLAFAQGAKVLLQPIENVNSAPRILAEDHRALEDMSAVEISLNVRSMAISSDGALLAVKEAPGEIRIWETASRSGVPLCALSGNEDLRGLWFARQSRWLAETGLEKGLPTIWLWDLEAPRGSSPIILRRGENVFMSAAAFEAQGRWLATAHANDVAFWWLGNDYPRVFRGSGTRSALVFTPDGRSLVSSSNDGTVRVWPVAIGSRAEPRILFRGDLSSAVGIAIDPQGRNVAVAGARGKVFLVPLDGSPVRQFSDFSDRVEIHAVAFGPDGRLLAAAPTIGPAEEKVIRVFDLETGSVQVLGPVPGVVEGFGGVQTLRFASRDRLIAGVAPKRNPSSPEAFHGIVSFDLTTGASTVVTPWPRVYVFFNNALTGGVGITTADPIDQTPLEPIRFRLDGTAPEPFRSRGHFWRAVFDPTDRLLATAGEDAIRIGTESGPESHVLLGHEVCIDVVFSPDGRWLATDCPDGTIRVIPVPDLSRPPLHTLPLDTLLGKLRTHTNVRAVADPVEATAYRLELGPFPGWAEPPEW